MSLMLHNVHYNDSANGLATVNARLKGVRFVTVRRGQYRTTDKDSRAPAQAGERREVASDCAEVGKHRSAKPLGIRSGSSSNSRLWLGSCDYGARKASREIFRIPGNQRQATAARGTR